MRDTEIEILKLVSELAENESDRFWTRYYTMLYANTAMLGIIAAIISFYPPKFIYALLICSFIGCAVSYVWWRIVGFGLSFQDRWIEDQKAIIDNNSDIHQLIKGRDKENDTNSDVIKAKKLYKFLPQISFIVWSILVIYSIFKILLII